MPKRLWTQKIKVKAPNKPESEVVIDYDHDPDTDIFTFDISGVFLSGSENAATASVLRYLAGEHRKVVIDRFTKIVPRSMQPLTNHSVKAMEQLVRQYQGGQPIPLADLPALSHDYGTQDCSGLVSDTLAHVTGTVMTGVTREHSHSVVLPVGNAPAPSLSQEDQEALGLIIEDLQNVYGEAEEGSSIETLAAAVLDLARLIKENR